MTKIPKKVLAAVEKMPAFPKSVQEVMRLTADINCSPKDLVDVIKNDPIFTLKILRVVNSPFVGLSKEITSIHQASVYLGVNTLKNMAIGLASVGALPRANKANFDMDLFWLHSLAVATVTKRLAEFLNIPRNESVDYFSAGLLHDIGKAVFALYMPEEFKTALAGAKEQERPLYELEQEIAGVTHADIGAVLAKKWDLPESLKKSIAMHHSIAEAEDLAIVDCLFAADQACKALQFGEAGEHLVAPLPQRVKDRINMDFDMLLNSLRDMEKEIDKARVFIQS